MVRLKDLLGGQDAKLLIASQQQFEATKFNSKLQSWIKELTIELQTLQEEHSIIKEDLRQHTKQLQEAKDVKVQRSRAEAMETKLGIVESRLNFNID